jgi:hypothetical protein
MRYTSKFIVVALQSNNGMLCLLLLFFLAVLLLTSCKGNRDALRQEDAAAAQMTATGPTACYVQLTLVLPSRVETL